MQPQQTNSPNPNMDFIMQSGQPPKKSFGLPKINLPKPVKIGLAGVGVLLLIIIVSSLLFGNKSGKFQLYINAMARGQEIVRVSTLVQNSAQDSTVQGLAATVQSTLSSQQAQMGAYIKSNKGKFSTKDLAVDKNSATDTQIQTAAQNNSLATTYESYLKQQLAVYKNDLSTAFNKATSRGKVILNNAYNSVQTLLNTPPLSGV